jgi:UDP-N-acetylmuramyl tripeptide synthase
VLITSTAAQAYALPAPVIGAELTVLKTSSSTAVQTISATLGGTAATIGLSGVTLTFSAADQSVILRGVSATKWQIASNVGSVTVS